MAILICTWVYPVVVLQKKQLVYTWPLCTCDLLQQLMLYTISDKVFSLLLTFTMLCVSVPSSQLFISLSICAMNHTFQEYKSLKRLLRYILQILHCFIISRHCIIRNLKEVPSFLDKYT